MVKQNGRRWIAIVFCSAILEGCVHFPAWHYGPDNQTREDFEQRVEAAFRLQNHMTSEVMVLQESSQDQKKQDAIFKAEQDMQDACGYLNEYASKEIDDLDAGFLLLNQVENSVAGCETAAHKLETLLKDR